MNDEDILMAEFESLRDDIINKHDELGMRASSDFANNLEIRQDRMHIELWGNHYVEQLVNGREPGRFPPVEAIAKWIQALDVSASSLAFLIARKISQEGTEYFKQGGTDLIDSVITPQRIQSIIDKVSQFYVNDFVLNVTNELKALAA